MRVCVRVSVRRSHFWVALGINVSYDMAAVVINVAVAVAVLVVVVYNAAYV